MDPKRLNTWVLRALPRNLLSYPITPGVVIYSPTTRATAELVIKNNKCSVNVTAEVFMRRGGKQWRDYTDYLEQKMEEDCAEDVLERASTEFLTKWFKENSGSNARRLGCRVDEVHVHSGMAISGGHSEHVHIKCRGLVPCGLAIKAAIETLQTVELLK